jgi:hypothetical protein
VRAWLAAGVVALFAVRVGAWVPVNDPPVTWAAEDLPVPWYLDERGSDDVGIDALEPAVQAGFDSWTNIDCCTIAYRYEGRTRASAGSSPGMFVLSFVESGWTQGEAIGVATTQWSGSNFTEADIEMNGEAVTWSVDGRGGTDVEAVVVHEVGHTVGLGDLYDAPYADSTMYYMTNGVESRSLAPDDIDGATTLYPGPCCQCTPGESGACPTPACGTGLHQCGEDCQWTACLVPDSGTEICDGYDNDCDGQTDEEVCGGCVPTAESCDGRDNDCDGVTDENRVCGPECTPIADTESCDGNDENCDGVIDDGCPCTAGTPARACGVETGSGRCREGQQECVGGTWGACVGALLPRRELCDGEDNDCDGTTDEDACNTDTGGGDDGCGCAVPGARRLPFGAAALGLFAGWTGLARLRRRREGGR